MPWNTKLTRHVVLQLVPELLGQLLWPQLTHTHTRLASSARSSTHCARLAGVGPGLDLQYITWAAAVRSGFKPPTCFLNQLSLALCTTWAVKLLYCC
jgi:hypothetical protein